MSRRPFKRSDRAGWAVKWDGGRRQRHFARKRDADAFADAQHERRLVSLGVPTSTPFEKHARAWLRRVASSTKRRTAELYGWALESYLLPALGDQPLSEITRSQVKDLLAELRTRPGRRGNKLAKRTIAHVWGTLRTCLESAKDDGLILQNPAEKLGRRMNLLPTRAEKGARIKALDAEQVARFQAAARLKLKKRDELLFRLMAGTGLRPGEAAALAWEDLDLAAKTALIRRTVDEAEESGVSDETKTGAERTVDLSELLVQDLKARDANTKAAALNAGVKRSRWVFASTQGDPANLSNMRKRFTCVLVAAGLPGAFSPQSLRHTYASLMLAAGEPLAYVAEQLGHADIRLTVHLYGRWLRKRAPGAVDRLEALVSKRSPSPA